MMTLIRIEMMKLIKRSMTWVLLFIQLGLLGFGTIVTILSMRNAPLGDYDTMIRVVTLPDSLANTTSFIYQFGVILLAILTASFIGGEYSWGTLRQLLAAGLSRTRFLNAKLLALALIAAVFVLLPLLAIVPLSVWVAHIEQQPIFTTSVNAAWLIALLGRTYLVIIMPMSLVLLIAVITQSQAVAVGAALGMVIIDQFASPFLWLLGFDWSLELVQFFPFWCARTLLGFNFTSLPNELPHMMNETRAIITLVGYTVLCVMTAQMIFRRRDVGGAV